MVCKLSIVISMSLATLVMCQRQDTLAINRTKEMATIPRNTTSSVTNVSSTAGVVIVTSTTPLPASLPTLPPVAPTPPKFPNNIGNWSVKGLRSPCILMKGALQLHVRNPNASELIIDVPSERKHVSVYGLCQSEQQTININWWSSNVTVNGSRINNTLSLTFAKLADQQYGLVSLKFHYTVKLEMDISGEFLPTFLKNSYRCKAEQRIQDKPNGSYMRTKYLQFEAFRQDGIQIIGEPIFNTPDECKADNYKVTGGILGGSVGIAIIIVALIALSNYLYKRYRGNGYQVLDNSINSSIEESVE